jgi:anti-anti-sigma factor
VATGAHPLQQPILIIRMHIRFGASETELLHLDAGGNEQHRQKVSSFTAPDVDNSRVRDPLREALESGIHRVIVDLSDVIVLSSVALAELIDWHNMIGGHKGTMVLCGIGGRVAQTLEVTKLIGVFKVAAGMEEAREMVKETRPI